MRLKIGHLEAPGNPAAAKDSRALTHHTNQPSRTHTLLHPAMHAALVAAVTARIPSGRMNSPGRSLIPLQDVTSHVGASLLFLQHLRPPLFRKIGPAARWREVDRSISATPRSYCYLSLHIPQQTSGAWTSISVQRLHQKMVRLSRPTPRATNHYSHSRSLASLEVISPASSSS
jgi:hypothetical protein